MGTAVVDLLLPHRCAACGRSGRGLCRACLCAAAGLRLADGAAVELAPGVLALAPFAYDGVVADAIRSVKTPGRSAPATWLGALLWAEITPHIGIASGWPRTWIPSTAARRRMRGAEVPRLLAGSVARPALRRVRQMHDQTALTAQQRRGAPKDDFRSDHPVPRDVVLVDDVRTTGGTARAAAAALQAAGARHVLVITLAAVAEQTRAAMAWRGQLYEG